MSKTNLPAMMVLALGTLPIAAQTVADAPGVSVNMNGAQLLHRTSVPYPANAMTKGIEGTVVTQLRLDANGEVIDASVLSGPDELRKGVLQSVLAWHFEKSAALTTRVVNVEFAKPAVLPSTSVAVTAGAPQLGPIAAIQQQQFQAMQAAASGTIDAITFGGLSENAVADLKALVPVHAGDPYSPQTMMQVTEAVRKFDQHLMVSANRTGSGAMTLRINSPGAGPGAVSVSPVQALNSGAAKMESTIGKDGTILSPVRVGGNVQAANLLSQTRPDYPPLAKAARVQGTVRFDATIGKDGTMQDLKVVSGPPLLIQSALDAVKTWVYKPTLMNGNPVDVVTTIDVTYTLAQDAPAAAAQ
jgi:TonB family protein